MDVDFAINHAPGLVIPQSAIQTVGSKNVVFVPLSSEGSFTLREVKVGLAGNGNSSILSGLRAGERVVTEGSFILKAEALRQHPELQ